MKVHATEHRGEIKRCDRCGKRSAAVFRDGVTHKVQYGPRLGATAVYLKNYGLLTYERTSQPFEDLFGVALSAGTLVDIDREARQRLVEVNERI
jgi:transposase